MEILKFYCPICNGTNVEGKAWVNLNGENPEIEFIESSDEEDFWCNDCQNHVKPILK